MDKCVQYATIMSVQGHHCFLIEQKLCNVSVPASVAKLGAWEETAGRAGGGPLRPQPTTAPGNRTLHAKMRDHKYQPIPITYKTFKVFYNKSRTHSSPYVAYLYG